MAQGSEQEDNPVQKVRIPGGAGTWDAGIENNLYTGNICLKEFVLIPKLGHWPREVYMKLGKKKEDGSHKEARTYCWEIISGGAGACSSEGGL